MTFEKRIEQQLEGGDSTLPFQSEWNEMARGFRSRLANAKPLISLPYRQKAIRAPTINAASVTPSPVSSSNATAPINLSSDEDSMPAIVGSKRPRSSIAGTPTPTKYRRIKSVSSNAQKGYLFKLEDVKSIIQAAYTGGIPSLVHPKAIEEMIKLSISRWDTILADFLQSTQHHLEEMVRTLAANTFHGRVKTKFLDELSNFIDAYFTDLFERHKDLCGILLRLESKEPRTLNEEALAVARNNAMLLLGDNFRLQRAHDGLDAIEKRNGKFTTGDARDEKAAKVTDNQLGPDIYDLELHAMAVSSLSCYNRGCC